MSSDRPRRHERSSGTCERRVQDYGPSGTSRETMNDETPRIDVRRASRRRLLATGAGGLALLAGCSGPGTGEDGEGGEGEGEEENEGEEGGEGEEGDEEEDEEGGEDDLSAGPERREVRPARGPSAR